MRIPDQTRRVTSSAPLTLVPDYRGQQRDLDNKWLCEGLATSPDCPCMWKL